jgi:arylsulfatase A-like enzyme
MKPKPRPKSVTLALISMACIGLPGSLAQVNPSPDSPPNFIVILTDDHGWTQTSVRMDKDHHQSKSDYIQTPNLERLAAAGMRFSQGYAPAPVCKPTRYSIQFGKTTARLHTTRLVGGVNVVNHDQPTLVQMLKKQNPDYVAAHLGKWHIDAEPEQLGYDLSDGMTSNGEGGFTREESIRWSAQTDAEDPKKTFSLSSRANRFMSDRVELGEPFFLQISYYAAHADLIAKPDTYEKYQRLPEGKVHDNAIFAAMVEDLDTGIGRVLDQVRALGIEDNTFIFMLADNGGVPRIIPVEGKYQIGYNYPLTRGKWDLLEGGLRVPFFIAGPGVPADSQCDRPVIGYDIMPTILELAGRNGPLPPEFDGGSLAPLFRGFQPVIRNTPDFIFHLPYFSKTGIGEPHSVVVDRKGRFKFLKLLTSGRTYLFDLENDLAERYDVSTLYPGIKARLANTLDQYLEEVDATRKEEASSWPTRSDHISDELIIESVGAPYK